MVLHTVGRVLLHHSRQYLTDVPTGPSVSSGRFFSWGSLFLSNSRLCHVDSKNCPSHGLEKAVVEATFLTGCRCWQLAFTMSLSAWRSLGSQAAGLDRGLCSLSINCADFFSVTLNFGLNILSERKCKVNCFLIVRQQCSCDFSQQLQYFLLLN